MQSGIPRQSAWSIAFIICTAWISVRGQMETTAVLDTSPKTVYAAVGSQAKLPCPITNPDEIDVTWFIDTNPVKIDNVTTVLSRIGPDAYSLILNNVNYENQAVYLCMLGAFPPSYKEVTLIIEGAPIINRASIKETYYLNEGQEFLVSCDTTGYPEPSIAWYVYKDPSNEGGEVKDFITRTKTLRIPMISRNDSGIFRCEATNKFGSVFFETQVEVKFKPNMTVKPEVISVQEGQSVSAVCIVESNPKAKVYWTYAHDSSRTRFATHPRTENDHYIQEIAFEIQNVTMEDKGVYKCLAMNDLGYTEQVMQMVVQSTTKRNESIGNGETVPINQTTGMNNTNVPDKHTLTIYTKEGTEAKLPCPISNANGMKVSWFFKGLRYKVKIDNVTKSMSMEGEDAYSLILHNVRADDVGKYLCVSHKVPPSVIEVILIIVVGNSSQVQATAIPVQLTTRRGGSNENGGIVPINQTTGMNNTNVPDKHTLTIYTKEGTEAKLPCPISNANGMKVNWFFHDLEYEVKIDNVTKSMSMEGEDAYSLILHNVRAEDVGKYLCVSHKVPPSVIEVILIIGQDESTTEDGPQADSSKDKNTASVFSPSFSFLGVITLLTLLVEGV